MKTLKKSVTIATTTVLAILIVTVRVYVFWVEATGRKSSEVSGIKRDGKRKRALVTRWKNVVSLRMNSLPGDAPSRTAMNASQTRKAIAG